MKIGLRGGHSANCIGAVGYFDEYTQCQKLYKRVAELLISVGNTIIDCNTNESTAQADLYAGTNKANANNVDFFASIHMNAGGGTGCEVWAYNSHSGKAVGIGTSICKNLSAQLGIKNRGVKYSTGLHDLRCPAAQSIIIETIFVDTKSDCEKYDLEKAARSIANGIDSRVSLAVSTPAPTPTPEPTKPSKPALPNVYYRVRANGRWLPEVKNLEDYAGIPGQAITDVAMRVDKGSIEYRVHTKGGRWLGWITKCNINDGMTGYAGNGKYIDAIQIIYHTPSDIIGAYGYKYAKYRVAVVGRDYYSWQLDTETSNNMDGYAGCFSKVIDKLQIELK